MGIIYRGRRHRSVKAPSHWNFPFGSTPRCPSTSINPLWQWKAPQMLHHHSIPTLRIAYNTVGVVLRALWNECSRYPGSGMVEGRGEGANPHFTSPHHSITFSSDECTKHNNNIQDDQNFTFFNVISNFFVYCNFMISLYVDTSHIYRAIHQTLCFLASILLLVL